MYAEMLQLEQNEGSVGDTSVKLTTNNTIYERPDFNYNDSYAHFSRWWFLTFKPYNDSYQKDTTWYQKKGLDYVRKLLPKGRYLITREIDSEKVHINVLISTDKDLKDWHDKAGRKYKIWCKPLDDQCHDRVTIYDYITKEALTRPFEKYSDYIIYYGTPS